MIKVSFVAKVDIRCAFFLYMIDDDWARRRSKKQ
jgi:hypothetical protein